jgi:hypothetical protein
VRFTKPKRCAAAIAERDALMSFCSPPDIFSRHHMEIIMKYERFLANTCSAICAFGVFVFVAGTSAALAQTPAPPADKSATKGPPTPAVTQPSSMDKKDSMMPGMPGMAAGGDMRGSMTGMMKNMESMTMTGDTDRDFATMMKMHHQGDRYGPDGAQGREGCKDARDGEANHRSPAEGDQGVRPVARQAQMTLSQPV